MSDLIDRQAAIEAIDKEYRCTDKSDDWDGLKTAMLIIDNLPSAPQRTGRWINIRNDNIAECDQCGITGRAWMNFCPICGARMEGES